MSDQKTRSAELDIALGKYISPRVPSEKLLEVFELAEAIPIIGPLVKPIGLLGGWWDDDRKPDRVFPVLKALRDKIVEAERSQNDYVHKEQFRDLFEETIKRIALEPDGERREWLKNALLKIIDQPKDHAENRLFIRLIEELSTDAHKVIAILDQPFTEQERGLQEQDETLSKRSGVPLDRIQDVKAELASNRLVNPERFAAPPTT